MFFYDQTGTLSKAQGDANTRELLARIATIAADLDGINSITGATFSGADFVLLLRNGSQLAIPVPWPTPTFQGEWLPATPYSLLTEVTVAGKGLYTVMVAHTSGASFDDTDTDGDGNLLYRKRFPLDAERYAFSFDVPGPMPANLELHHDFLADATIPADFGAYLGRLTQIRGAATATSLITVPVAKAPLSTPTVFSDVGSITIGAGLAIGSGSTSSVPLQFAQGDTIRLKFPASPDATFLSFRATIVGFETP